jgi:hypothetical protein
LILAERADLFSRAIWAKFGEVVNPFHRQTPAEKEEERRRK